MKTVGFAFKWSSLTLEAFPGLPMASAEMLRALNQDALEAKQSERKRRRDEFEIEQKASSGFRAVLKHVSVLQALVREERRREKEEMGPCMAMLLRL